MDERSPWSDCPKDILAAIAKRFDSPTDILRLRSICTWWRSSVTSPFHKSPPFLAKLPFPISPDDSINPNRYGYFALTEIITYRLEPLDAPSNSSSGTTSKGWLVTIEEGAKPGKMRVLNPLLLFEDPVLPESFPKVLNLFDFRVSVITRAYNLRYVDSSSIPVNSAEKSSLSVRKTVVSSDPPNWTSTSDLAVLVILNSGNLGLFKTGDEKWTTSDDPPDTHFDDIINYKGKFYAVDRAGRLVMLDSSMNGKEIVPALASSADHKHLVESSGDLLLVDITLELEELGNYPTIFEVFKLNEQEHCWIKVESLHDKVLFLGDQCFSISSRDFHGSNGNCIYFRDDYIGLSSRAYCWPNGLSGRDTCVYTLEDVVVGPLDWFPGYVDIYWPPPTNLVA